MASSLAGDPATTPSQGPAAAAHLPLRTAAESPTGVRKLANREIAVLRLVATGLSNKAIANQLGITQKTVRNHMSAVFFKLGVSNRTAAALYMLSAGDVQDGVRVRVRVP